MATAKTTSSPVDFFLGDALATLGSDAAFYFGNQLSQDTPDSELALYAAQQRGYGVQLQDSAALRYGSAQPTVTAGASTTLNGQTLLVLAVVIGVVILAAKSK